MSKRLRLVFCALALTILAAVVAVIAIGGRPDPIGSAVALDGPWRFHPGDDPRWADARFDDRAWDRIDLVSLPENRDNDVGLPGWLAGWRAHGHPNLEGYGWYRRRVALPATDDLVLLGPTMVDDGYQMFWNGRPIGGVGKLDGRSNVIGARPFMTKLPRAAGERSGFLAIRTFMEPGFGRDHLSGGLRSVPTLATAAFGETLHRAQWLRTIAGYIVEVAIPFMMILLAGLTLRNPQSNAGFVKWLAVALVTSGCLRLGNAIAAWSDLLNVSTLSYQNAIILSPLAMLSWTAAWNDWADGRDRPVVLLIAIMAWAGRVAGAVIDANALTAIARIVFLVLFALIAIRIVRHGERRMLALATMLAVATALFVNELREMGIPDIWFPFNIGVTLTQYAYALTIFLLPFLLSTSRSSDQAVLCGRRYR